MIYWLPTSCDDHLRVPILPKQLVHLWLIDGFDEFLEFCGSNRDEYCTCGVHNRLNNILFMEAEDSGWKEFFIDLASGAFAGMTMIIAG